MLYCYTEAVHCLQTRLQHTWQALLDLPDLRLRCACLGGIVHAPDDKELLATVLVGCLAKPFRLRTSAEFRRLLKSSGLRQASAINFGIQFGPWRLLWPHLDLDGVSQVTCPGHPMELIGHAVDDLCDLVDKGHDSSLKHLRHKPKKQKQKHAAFHNRLTYVWSGGQA